MQIDDDMPSGYGDNKESNFESINFSRATRLGRSGSTCDAYIVRMRHKTVFVKRLKEELRSSPRERTAFEKEYELGINLVHPALPIYRAKGDDYIVMDYVDGTTLADMIAKRDPWLMNSENIRGMLRQLVDVVGYMHRKNVLHSDIKPDNVMITYGTRNTVLIDLDKAYTFTHNDTAGAPGKYGLPDDDHGNPAIDYNGIAGIVRRLTAAGFPTKPFRRFERKLAESDVTADKLLNALKPGRKGLYAFIVVGIAAVTALAFALALTPKSPAADEDIAGEEIVEEEVITPVSADTTATEPEVPKAEPKAVVADNYEAIINRGLEGHFASVDEQIVQVEKLLQSGSATDAELREANYAVNRSVGIAIQSAYTLYDGRFPDVDAIKVQMAVASSPACRKILDRQASLSKRIAAEIMRRHPSSYTASDSSYLGL